MKRNIKTFKLSGIEWGGDLEYYDDYGTLIPLPNTFELGVSSTKKITIGLLEQYLTDGIFGYGSKSYVVKINKVELVITKRVDIDITEELMNGIKTVDK